MEEETKEVRPDRPAPDSERREAQAPGPPFENSSRSDPSESNAEKPVPVERPSAPRSRPSSPPPPDLFNLAGGILGGIIGGISEGLRNTTPESVNKTIYDGVREIDRGIVDVSKSLGVDLPRVGPGRRAGPIESIGQTIGDVVTGGLSEISRAAGQPAEGRPPSFELEVLRRTLKTVGLLGPLGLGSVSELLKTQQQLRALMADLRRRGIDPALGMIGILADCLDGLEVLFSTSALPLPPELAELRLILLRLRQIPLSLSLKLPVSRRYALTAGRLVRTLVEGQPGLDASEREKQALEEAVAQAYRFEADRLAQPDPMGVIEVNVELRLDTLTVELKDSLPVAGYRTQGRSSTASSVETDDAKDSLDLARAYMDTLDFSQGEAGSTLSMRRKLRFQGLG